MLNFNRLLVDTLEAENNKYKKTTLTHQTLFQIFILG